MHLLDSSALLALLHNEAGAGAVAELATEASVLSVNLEETVGTLTKEGMPPESVRQALEPLALSILPFTEPMAWLSGSIRARLPAGLGVADRCCLAAAAVLGLTVVTADSLWRDAAGVFGIQLMLIR